VSRDAAIVAKIVRLIEFNEETKKRYLSDLTKDLYWTLNTIVAVDQAVWQPDERRVFGRLEKMWR
jgi:hypothetical protein